MKYSFKKNRHHGLYVAGAGFFLLAFALMTNTPQTTCTAVIYCQDGYTTSACSNSVCKDHGGVLTTTTSTVTTTTVTTTTIPVPTTTTTSTTTTTVTGNQPPHIISASQKPNPVKIGKTATFNIVAADAESEFVTVSVCKNAQCTGRYCSVQGTTKPNGATFSCTYDIPVTIKNSFNYWAKAEEAGRSSEIVGPFVLNVTSV